MSQMAESIYTLVKERETVTFAEILKNIPGAKGDQDFLSDKAENVFFWMGLSEEVCDAIIELRNSDKIYMHPAHMLTYIADGAALTIPIAKHPPKGGYKKPHWLPVCFCTYPHRDSAE